jgi:hypothetical protein
MTPGPPGPGFCFTLLMHMMSKSPEALRARLEKLRSLQFLLDNRYRVPGTNIRFGWDALVGLIPGAGDLVTALFAGGLIVQAHQMGVPRVIQLRMVINVLIDIFIGVVPLFGDVVDVFWKSNARNFALLERHARTPSPPSKGDWLFVTGVLALVGAVAILPLAMMYWLVQAMMSTGILR